MELSWSRIARALAGLAIVAAAVGAPALDTSAKSRQPVVVEAPPPPPPPPGDVGLPQRLLADAAAYQAYLERVTATSPGFTSGAGVAQALKNGAAYEPRALIRGAIAYGAVAALENPTFVAQVRAAGNSPENRRLMVGYLAADPGYAFLFRGSDAAAGLAREAIGSAGMKLYAAAKPIKQSAYDVQHQSWSKADVLDRGARLAAVEAGGANPPPPAADHVAALQRAASGAAPLTIAAPAAQPPYTPLVAHAVQLAAIAALGEASDETYGLLSTLAADETTATCLHMAKLNLYQCLAVAKPNYEDIFCIGQHVMSDAGACLVRNAGMTMPLELSAPPLVVPSAVVKPVVRRRRK